MNKTNLVGSMLGMGKRLITERQETILRMCHQDFEGLSQTAAAKKLGISQSAVSAALAKCKKAMPQMFPVLTRLEADCYKLYIDEKWEVDDIAEHFGLTPNSVYKTLKRVREKGMYWPLLTVLEEKYYQLYTIEGLSVKEIADRLGKSQTTVYEGLKRARDEGMACLEAKGKMLSYEPSMDADVIHKF